MYDGRDKNTNSQINSSTKHILYTYEGAKNKINFNKKMNNISNFEYHLPNPGPAPASTFAAGCVEH